MNKFGKEPVADILVEFTYKGVDYTYKLNYFRETKSLLKVTSNELIFSQFGFKKFPIRLKRIKVGKVYRPLESALPKLKTTRTRKLLKRLMKPN